MKTFPITSQEDELVGFEIRNLFLSSHGIARRVRGTNGCEVVATRRWFSGDEIHVRFRFAGKEFLVWEPFGDNSRLWVGPENGENVSQATLAALEAAFQGRAE